MPRRKPHIYIIVGPTASGKSALGVILAKKIDGEIVSADSRQVYKGMDIGTAKITKEEMEGIPHHCIDIAPPDVALTAADYAKEAEGAIKKILKKKKTPIIVGGTGFYIDAVAYGNSLPSVPPNEKLREELERQTTEELFAALERKDPERALEIDQKNKRRIIRALEIIDSTGGPVPKVNQTPKYDITWIGLNPDKDVLRKKIASRTNAMLRHGLVKEVRDLLDAGVTEDRIRELGFEYSLPLEYIRRRIRKHNLVRRLNSDSWKYVKRQMTWFRRNSEIEWFASAKDALNRL